MLIDNPEHTTKMAAMHFYVKNPSEIFSRTDEQIAGTFGNCMRE